MAAAVSPRGMCWRWCWRLALADLRAAPLRSALEVSALGISLGLLILLWGLHTGLVSGFATEELETPEARRIYVSGYTGISANDLAWLNAQVETGFVQPSSSFINERQLLAAREARMAEVLLLPSATGDPYLPPGIFLESGEIAIGNDVAAALDVDAGDTVRFELGAVGSRESVTVPQTVVAVLETARWYDRAVFVDPFLVNAIDQRGSVPEIVFDGSRLNYGIGFDQSYSSIRIYARSVDDVAPLAAKISTRGWNAQSRARLIEERQAVQDASALVFAILMSGVFLGIALGAALGIVNRSLRLIGPLKGLHRQGFSRVEICAVPLLQALVLAGAGWIIACGIGLAGMVVLNTSLPGLLVQLRITDPPVQIATSVFPFAGLLALVFCVVGGAGAALGFLNWIKDEDGRDD